ncbi:MAG TPA: ABC transporter ATP-binding protein [Thermoleophilaceae bacterium]|nr:ABC transporter ATP-binding protein [Thermoleophilaceae bacterium]
MSLLEVEELEAGYGAVVVLRGVSFDVKEGQVAAILGPNGAGKTTSLRAISGLVDRSGRIELDGESIAGASPERIARMGVAHVPEGRGTFSGLTVRENLRAGAYARRDRSAIREDMDRCLEYFPRLRERLDERAGKLSGGEQQMLAIARGLMMKPRLLLLDEPSIGLAPVLTRELFRRLEAIAREERTTVLLVEQNAALALGIADYAYVLEAGRIVHSGEAEQMREEEVVQQAYLGY